MNSLTNHKISGTDKTDIRRCCFLAGTLAALIMVFTYLVHEQSLFFGDNTVLRMDLYHQYGPLYAELYDRIVNGYSLVYSWTSGLGGSFIGNLFNYCCSPFALIIFFFGHKNMPEAIAVMIFLKAIVASVTFTYFINKSTRKTHLFSAGFGVLYAFCGFFIAYSWNIMWLDAMSVFPLVMLGIERIVEERRPSLFIFSLTFTMITNYYMAFMVCILSALYFLYYYFGSYAFGALIHMPAPTAQMEADPASEEGTPAPVRAKKPREKISNRRLLVSGGMFAFSGLLSFFLAAFALVPVFICLQSSSATSSTFPENSQIYFNFFDFISNHLPALEPTIRSSGEDVLPNVYCGLISMLLLPFYFLSDKISGRRKVAAVVFLGVFYISFSINYFNYIWHGLHFPNDLPYRFSFAYSFLLLTLAYQAIMHLHEFTRRHFIAAGLVFMLFVVFVDEIGSKNVDHYTVVLSLIFCVVYIVIAGLMTSSRYTKSSLSKLLIFAIVMELCFANTAKYTMQQSKSNYTGDYDAYQRISGQVEGQDEELFYRTELTHLRARMDPCWYGYRGVSTFSSMAYEKTSATMRKLGFFGNNINSYTYYPQTPIFNSMFSIRYLYDNANMLSEGDLYSYLRSDDPFKAYRYNYFLPITFSVSRDVKNWDLSASDPFTIQNELMSLSTGAGEILTKVDATDFTSDNLKDNTLEFMNDNDVFTVYKENESATAQLKMIVDIESAGNYYVYAGSQRLSSIHIIANSFDYHYATSGIDPFIVDVGPLEAGDQISVEYNIDDTSSFTNIYFCAARLDLAEFRSAYKTIERNGTIQYAEFDDTHFAGTIDVKNADGFMFTSIPYDKSWEILVDGQKLAYASSQEIESGDTDGKIIALGDGFLGFDIEKGEHTLEFRYKARGLTTGLAMTGIGVFVLLLLLLVRTLKKRNNRSETENVAGNAPEEKQGTEENRKVVSDVVPAPDGEAILGTLCADVPTEEREVAESAEAISTEKPTELEMPDSEEDRQEPREQV